MKSTCKKRLAVLVAVWLSGNAVHAADTTPPEPATEPVGKTSASVSPAEVETRVQQLLAQLTADEKLKLLAGVKGFYTNDIPRLNLPRLKMSDGPMGARNDGTSTAFPAGALLAATWDPAIAKKEGVSIGRDCRARDDSFILGPGMNIYRVPMNGRNFEYFGEDPYLAGQIAVGYIQGVQSQGVAACAKHFAANNQETQRDSIDETIDERALHEIYLPAFEASVKQGHVASVMSAYNKVNGAWITANTILQTDILKHDWHFNGLLMSDWGAVHEALSPLNAGLDLEMPGPAFFKPDTVMQLVQDGKVSQASIDDKVSRLLRVAVEMGWLDRPQKDPTISTDDPFSNDTALQVAREGVVLLKNDGNFLPLDRTKVKTVAVLGPNADRFVGGGGSGKVDPARFVSILDGIRSVAGPDVNVVAIPFHGVSATRLSAVAKTSAFEGGLHAEFFDNPTLSGSPTLARTDPHIDYNWQWNLPLPGLTSWAFSARWTGQIKPTADGPYRFLLTSHDGSRVYLDDKMILDKWSGHDARLAMTTVLLKANQSYQLRVEYCHTSEMGNIRFGYEPANPVLTDAEHDIVAKADAAVVCVGTDDSESVDRDYALEADQENLIRQTAAANPHTAVILNSGGNVAMKDWIGQVPALIDGFYTGQAQGTALAEVLFGDTNPSGHLPDTFEQDWPDAPAYGHYPGENGHVTYAEGIYVGYRWFDKKRIEPRFCFGQGLSYTTFKIDGLQIEPAEHDSMTIQVNVTNTGTRAGATVAQLYVHPPQDGVDRPRQELKGFDRVDLQPGQSKTVTMSLHPRSFAYWDTSSHSWKAPAGTYGIAVGLSSRDEQCTGTVQVK